MSTGTASQKLSRDDWRKKKELEEARKAGTAPAEVDELGRDINPHIPQYISQAPWYVSLGRASLSHQRPQEIKQTKYNSLNEWYKKGSDVLCKTATKFRKGACENCGSMTHKKKDCLERPRKMGAKFTGKNIRPDEDVQPQLVLTYDGKRDRWNGYNPDDHQAVIEEYQKVERAKQQLKAEKLQSELLSGQLSESSIKEAINDSDDSGDDEDKYADQADMAGQKFDPKTRITVRNLRIREDTAKYLYNLDPNSAFYDPKTRSMRENPFQNIKEPSEIQYAGENFVRHTGDVRNFANTQMFAWEAYEHGTDIHPLADPTKLEMMHKEFKVKKNDFKSDQQQSILEKYGGEEHLDAPPKELLLAQTEHYVEYSRLGNVIKGQEKAVAKSKYEEDVHINNHTSVWGSYWQDGNWGYECCHSLIKGSYCTGEAGKLANRVSLQRTFMLRDGENEMEGEGEHGGDSEEESEPQTLLEQHKEKIGKKSKKELREEQLKKEKEEALDKQRRLKEALMAEEERERKVDKLLAIDERKRPYHSMKANECREPTEEEMEAFRMKRRRMDDPMADFV